MAYEHGDYNDNPTHCATCGSEIEPGARFCPNCGAAAAQTPPGVTPSYAPGMGYEGGPDYGAPVQVPNYLAWAIVLTVIGALGICCYGIGIPVLVPAIVALVFATQVNGRLQAGDYNGALSASNNVRIWCWIATGLSILGIVVFGLIVAFVGFLGIISALGS